jgi:hypothetical protein
MVVSKYDTYFVMKKDVVGLASFSSIQKCIVAMRVLAYGAPTDTQDEYWHLYESTTIDV